MTGPDGPVWLKGVPTGPAELARRARPAGSVLPLTTVVAAIAGRPPGHPLGVFLKGLFDVADRPAVPSLPGPLRVPSDHLTTGQKQTAGTVFDVALRQRLGADITGPVRSVIELAAAGGVVVPQQALVDGIVELTSTDGGARPREQQLRDAVVVAWCEIATVSQLAMIGSPLTEMAAARTWDELTAHAPAALLADAAELLALAEDTIVPDLVAADAVTHVDLSHGPVAAVADVISAGAIIDLKSDAGHAGRSGPVFPIGRAVLRQLAGYALMPAAAPYGVTAIGVYAARFGQTWVSPLEQLLADTTWDAGSLADMRAAMRKVVAPPYR